MRYPKKESRISKNIVFFIGVILVLLLSSLFFYVKNTPGEETQVDTAIGIKSIIEYTPNEIAVHFPETSNKQINDILSSFAKETIEDFKSKCTEENVNGELSMIFESYRNSKNIVSFKFSFSINKPNLANSIESIKTMVFNLETGKEIQLQDIFKEDIYLKVVSKESYDQLSKLSVYQDSKTELEMLREGTKAKSENFNSFVLNDKQIIIMFAPYQVGSRVNSVNSVSIPLSKFGKAVKTTYLEKIKGTLSLHPERISNIMKLVKQESDDDELKDKKLIAITFDDGPNDKLTPQLLDILDNYNVKATFYMLGSRATYYPEIVQEVAKRGHQIGSHTEDHKDLTKLSETEIQEQINKTDEAIKKVTGTIPTTIRPPYGAYNDIVLKNANRPIVLWSIDTLDWKSLNADTVYQTVMQSIEDGDVILLHDIHKTSIEAADKMIGELKKQGYEFVTVDQLIRLRNKDTDKQVFGFMKP